MCKRKPVSYQRFFAYAPSQSQSDDPAMIAPQPIPSASAHLRPRRTSSKTKISRYAATVIMAAAIAPGSKSWANVRVRCHLMSVASRRPSIATSAAAAATAIQRQGAIRAGSEVASRFITVFLRVHRARSSDGCWSRRRGPSHGPASQSRAHSYPRNYQQAYNMDVWGTCKVRSPNCKVLQRQMQAGSPFLTEHRDGDE